MMDFSALTQHLQNNYAKKLAEAKIHKLNSQLSYEKLIQIKLLAVNNNKA